MEENKKYAYFLRMKKGVVRRSSAPKRWGVKGGGLGEDMRSNRNALHPAPELETETFRIPYKQRKTITKSLSLSFFRRKEYNINL